MGYLYGTMAELRPSPDGAMAVLVSPSTCSNQHHDHTNMDMQHGPLRNLLHRLKDAKGFCHSNFKSEHAQVTWAGALKQLHTQHHLRKTSLVLAKAIGK